MDSRESMSRILAYLFVSWMAFGVTAASVVLVWAIFFDDKGNDFKGIAAVLAFMVWWSWAGIDIYSRYIKPHREGRKQLRAEGLLYLEKLRPGLPLSETIEEIRNQFLLVGEPRYRDSLDPAFDIIVELETEAFIVSLVGRGGAIQSWRLK